MFLSYKRSKELILKTIDNSNAPEIIKCLLGQCIPSLVFRVRNDGGVSFFRQTSKTTGLVEIRIPSLLDKILMNLGSIVLTASICESFKNSMFHELGHAIDHIFGNKEKGDYVNVSDTLFCYALDKSERIVDDLIDNVTKNNKSTFFRNLKNLKLENDGVSDIIHIVSRFRYNVLFCHDEKYFLEDEIRKGNEIFANLVQLYAFRDYKSLRKLKFKYQMGWIIDTFIYWLNEVSISNGIELDRELNAILNSSLSKK